MSIPDFDVEPAVGPRFWMVLLGVGSAITGLLAVIGWPLPLVSGRGGPDRHAWAQTVRSVRDWFAYDGWRMSGASWFYGALAAAALAGILVLRNPAWSGTRSLLVVVVPAAALLVLGPAAQWALGLPWSNYGAGSTGVIAVGMIVAVIVGAAITWLPRAFRRSVRSDDDVNPPPRGVH
ncbi:hypothetical protein [Curtobacterium sp. 24E2]|nr:hypothetical protein JN350_16900 [Curtobacterium sp. 24E2]